jgi:hypothetical protein
MNIVPENERLDFLPTQFKSHFLEIENCVYMFADKLIVGYTGGYWHFATENTEDYGVAAFMFIKYDKVKIQHLFSDEEVEVDGVLAGMIVTSFAIEYLYNKVFDDFLVDKLDALKTVALQYSEEHGFARQYFRMTD